MMRMAVLKGPGMPRFRVGNKVAPRKPAEPGMRILEPDQRSNSKYGALSTIGQLPAHREPPPIADDRSGQRVADFDMQMKPVVLGILIRVAAWCEPSRHRHPEQAPAPDDQPQPGVIQYQRHCGFERAEALAQQPLVASASLFLRRVKRTASEAARPALASVLQLEVDTQRNVRARTRKSDDRGRD